jgi:hypothetical protein
MEEQNRCKRCHRIAELKHFLDWKCGVWDGENLCEKCIDEIEGEVIRITYGG